MAAVCLPQERQVWQQCAYLRRETGLATVCLPQERDRSGNSVLTSGERQVSERETGLATVCLPQERDRSGNSVLVYYFF